MQLKSPIHNQYNRVCQKPFPGLTLVWSGLGYDSFWGQYGLKKILILTANIFLFRRILVKENIDRQGKILLRHIGPKTNHNSSQTKVRPGKSFFDTPYYTKDIKIDVIYSFVII